MKPLVSLFNEMQKKKIIRKWALGGGVAAKYYVNPPVTKDIDFFVIVDDMSLSFMGPIYAYMLEQGAVFDGHLFKFKGVIIDIIPAMNELVTEAVNEANTVVMEGAHVNIIDPNYLAAIALSVGRKKDIDRVNRLLDAGKLTQCFKQLVLKYDLPLERMR